MVMLRAHKVVVLRDETTRISKDVWEWELPILEARHPEGYVMRSDDDEAIEVEREELPDAEEEFNRLTRVYGTDDTNRDLTELVYGYRGKGIAELAKLINAAAGGVIKTKAKTKGKTKGKAKVEDSEAEPVTQPVDPFGDE